MNKNKLGARLSKYIREKYKYQGEFAKESKISSREISELVNGRNVVMTVKLADKLEKATNIKAKEWFSLWIGDYYV